MAPSPFADSDSGATFDSGGSTRVDAGGATEEAEAPPVDVPDAAIDPPFDAWVPPADVVTPTPIDRMTSHGGSVLSSMRLVAVYFGEANVNGAASWDPFMTWLVKSAYWGTMKQYCVGPGTFAGSIRLDPSVLHASGDAGAMLVDADTLETTLQGLLHPGSNGAIDGGLDADDSDARTPSPIPVGDGYIFFLPDGLNVTFLNGADGTTWTSCIDFGGYHAITPGHDPYAVIPPCAFGRSGLAISHELAEMATDPGAGDGWFSDADVDNGGGEIGDICNSPATVEGWTVTHLWSNADGTCEPIP